METEPLTRPNHPHPRHNLIHAPGMHNTRHLSSQLYRLSATARKTILAILLAGASCLAGENRAATETRSLRLYPSEWYPHIRIHSPKVCFAIGNALMQGKPDSSDTSDPAKHHRRHTMVQPCSPPRLQHATPPRHHARQPASHLRHPEHPPALWMEGPQTPSPLHSIKPAPSPSLFTILDKQPAPAVRYPNP